MTQFRINKSLTKTPILALAVYTSETLKVEQYNHVRVLLSSDQSGSLVISQSDDNVTFVVTSTTALTGGTPAKIDEVCYANYLKAVYTNGAVNQTTFYLSMNADPL